MRINRWTVALLVLLLNCWALSVSAKQAEHNAEIGLLWRVSGNGLVPSHLFGTMHSEHEDIIDLPREVRAAMNSADEIVLEMVLDEAGLREVAEATRIRQGPDLAQLLDEALYTQVVGAMQGYGLPEPAVRGLQPWAAAMMLAVPKPETGLFLDRVLYLEAQHRGKPVHGLETAAEQVDIFASLPLDEQIEYLRSALALLPEQGYWMERLRQAYLSRDLARIRRLSEENLASLDPALSADFNRRVVLERNQRMFERILPRLRGGNTFIAVGALHLAGEQGLLARLRRAGYQVEAVY